MNPPSALHGAMSRERKPFTYTPGGLNLSEIKSERMAKRLIRNAMNQGVPETPAQNIKSPPISSNMAIPNFNCLPVQVFPTFNLPSNPKSLLRTRSNPEHPKQPITKKVAPAPQIITAYKSTETDSNRSFNNNNNNNVNPYLPANNNNYVNVTRPTSMYEYNTQPTHIYDHKTSYGSNSCTIPLLPEKSFDAEYFQVTPQGSKALGHVEIGKEINEIQERIPMIEPKKNITFEVLDNPVTHEICDPIEIVKPLEDFKATDDDQKEVKIVQKQVNVAENQNGDTNVEAAITVKLPVKKSAAKTETKVEIENKILPDGTVEETKITTTKTTVDGKVDISTKTEKRILSKEEADAVIEIEEEEEEEEETEEDGESKIEKNVKETVEISSSKEDDIKKDDKEKQSEPEEEKSKTNGHDGVIIKQEERKEVTTTKKVVIVQSDDEEEVVEEEEEEEVEEVEVKKETQREESVEKQTTIKEYNVQEANDIEIEENDADDEEIEQEETKTELQQDKEEKKVEEKEEQKGEENEGDTEEEKEELKTANADIKEDDSGTEVGNNDEVSQEQDEEEVEEEEEYEVAEEVEETEVKQEAKALEPERESENKSESKDDIEKKDVDVQETVQESESKQEDIPIKVIIETNEASKTDAIKEELKKPEEEKPEQKPPLREPSIPLEKVIDVEIKPIDLNNDLFTKSHKQNTEIITTSTDKPLGGLTTQTEYNRIENIVTVNRTTKTLNQAYEQMIQPVPTVKTYFAPNRDAVSVSPQLNRPYQPVYPPEQPERRHSLLLERLSMERQIPPADIYQSNYQSSQTEESQWSEEPQSEVLTVSNVKPSTITKNQQWYQQTKKENVTYNNVTPTIITTPSQHWNQPQPQSQQPVYQNESQPHYQSQTQPQYQHQPQPLYQSPQPQYQSPQTKPQFQAPQQQYQSPSVQPSYTENITKDTYKSTNNYSQNLYPGYSPKPTNWSSTIDNQTSYSNIDSSENYQKSTQQYSSSYVPPPWEQDSAYIADTANQNYFQTPPASSAFTPTNIAKPAWKPTTPAGKFTKPTPTSYIPPAPNQSFVKTGSNVDPPKQPGLKTYYSEYERRYISVPESTYIPTESKYQAQPDPSPKYYYDNNEPVETVEPQWRKELREFTEKTSQTTIQTEETSVRPPWEEDPKYAKTEYTPTPTWSQTLKPRSWRERSFESEYVGSKEWPKTNTLGRGRPQSSYVKRAMDSPIPERTRGVSVDRYNPNNYQSPIPSEHPPVQTYTLNPNVQPQNYHNPSVPAYHARVGSDNREQPATVYQQPRPHWSSESRATPIQSRSFKYLQWITGTED